jgi:hypothetical protein
LGRLIKALTAVAREEGFEVEFHVAQHPTKTEKKAIFLKPRHREAEAKNQ